MNHAEYLESHPEYRSLFPTQKMYDDFVRFMEMDEEERRLFAEEDKKRVDAMSPEEREQDWNNVVIHDIGISSISFFASYPLAYILL